MHRNNKGKWFLDSYFHLKRAPAQDLSIEKIADLKLTLKQYSKRKETLLPEQEDSYPQMPDLTCLFITFFIFYWTFAQKWIFFFLMGLILGKFQKSIQLLGKWSISYGQYFQFTFLGFFSPRL